MTTLVELLDALRRWHLLEPGQLDTLTRQWGPKRTDPRAAVKKLVEQGWLTHFQANQLNGPILSLDFFSRFLLPSAGCVL